MLTVILLPSSERETGSTRCGPRKPVGFRYGPQRARATLGDPVLLPHWLGPFRWLLVGAFPLWNGWALVLMAKNLLGGFAQRGIRPSKVIANAFRAGFVRCL